MSEIDFSTSTKVDNKAVTTNDGVDDPNKTTTEDLGEGFLEYGGKRMSKEDVLKKLQHADAHIQTLVSEQRERDSALQELLELVRASTNMAEVLKAQSEQPVKESNPDPVVSQIDPDEVVKKAVKVFNEQRTLEDQKAKEAENWKTVTNALTERFGDQVNAKVAEVANKHGMTVEAAAQLAKNNPTVFLALFPKPAPSPSAASLNTRSPLAVSAQLATVKRDGPSLFKASTVKEQVQIYRDRLAAILQQ